MNAIDEIIISHENGQFEQTLDLIREFGWYDFMDEIRDSNNISDVAKIDLIATAIKLDILQK